MAMKISKKKKNKKQRRYGKCLDITQCLLMGVFILVELFFKKVISFKHTHNLNLERLSIHQGTTFSSLNGDIMVILQLLALLQTSTMTCCKWIAILVSLWSCLVSLENHSHQWKMWEAIYPHEDIALWFYTFIQKFFNTMLCKCISKIYTHTFFAKVRINLKIYMTWNVNVNFLTCKCKWFTLITHFINGLFTFTFTTLIDTCGWLILQI